MDELADTCKTPVSAANRITDVWVCQENIPHIGNDKTINRSSDILTGNQTFPQVDTIDVSFGAVTF